MKLKHLLPLLTILTLQFSFAQTPQKVVVATEDPYNLYNFEPTDTTSLFYLKLVPKTKPNACLVILPSSGELVESVMAQITLHKLALKKGMLVVFPSINWGTNKFDEEHKLLDVIFKQVAEQYSIPKDRFVIGGFSGGAMISLSYAEKAHREPGATYITPKAVFALDPPVDYAHLYHHAKRDVERNFSEPAVNEGHWIMDSYKEDFGGSPEEVPAQYVKYSIYSHNEPDGGNAKFLLTTPLRIYTEPDIEWQLTNRHRDAYDMNSTDISAMVNLLQTKGNDKVSLIVTHNKGYRPNGMRHPHSWSIMDSKTCLDWILQQLK
nr:hypothetical protein [uncultured Flavobacterium sp.]